VSTKCARLQAFRYCRHCNTVYIVQAPLTLCGRGYWAADEALIRRRGDDDHLTHRASHVLHEPLNLNADAARGTPASARIFPGPPPPNRVLCQLLGAPSCLICIPNSPEKVYFARPVDRFPSRHLGGFSGLQVAAAARPQTDALHSTAQYCKHIHVHRTGTSGRSARKLGWETMLRFQQRNQRDGKGGKGSIFGWQLGGSTSKQGQGATNAQDIAESTPTPSTSTSTPPPPPPPQHSVSSAPAAPSVAAVPPSALDSLSELRHSPRKKSHSRHSSFGLTSLSDIASATSSLRRSVSLQSNSRPSTSHSYLHSKSPSDTLALSYSPERAPHGSHTASRPTLSISTFTRKQKSAENVRSHPDRTPLSSVDANGSVGMAAVPLRHPTSARPIGTSHSNVGFGQGSAMLAPPATVPLPSGPNPMAVFQHVHDMASKRISTLDYLRKA
jgi:hypothetical protein